MRHPTVAVFAALGLFAAPTAADGPPPLAREFRGVWVATVGNIDWPSKPGLPADVQKREFVAILDKCVELKLNAVVFQVRPAADALYESKLEPWSEYLTGQQGRPPEPRYDPLAFAVAEAHARGLELHAWFNPYRAKSPTGKGPVADTHLVKARPDLAKPYGKHHWLNPTNPEVQAHSLAVFRDVVRRYDIDGIHIDDYFYPYKEKDAAGNDIPFPDDDTWAAYQKAGGKLARDDWRRDAVNALVRRMYAETKAVKPWVKVGISPFGIWRPGHPPEVQGFDQYAELYADAKLWLNEGWVDYFTPQLYWPIASEKQSFPKLLAWWAGENAKGRHLWPGLYTGRSGRDAKAKGWPASEIADQIGVIREQGAGGEIHFSMKALMRNSGGVADVLKGVYAEPALVPASEWLPADKPATTMEVDGNRVATVKGDGVRFVIVRALKDGKWTTTISGPRAVLPAADRTVLSYVDRTGRETRPLEKAK